MTPKKIIKPAEAVGPDPAHTGGFLALPLQVRLAYYGVATPGALSPLLWGMPGVAKTSFGALIAKALDMHFITVMFSDRAPEDIGGTPMPVGDKMRRYPPDFIVEAAEVAASGRKVLVLADEVTTVPQPVQAPLLRFVLERVSGDVHLDAYMVRLMLAANPVEQAANGQDIAFALASRMQHVEWNPLPIEMWIENEMAGPGGSGLTLPSFPEEAWAKLVPQAAARIAGFLRKRPSAYAEDPAKSEGRGYGQFACPRSWSKFKLVRAAAMAFGDTDALIPLATGILGEPVAIEMATWERKQDLPDAEDMLDGKVDFEHDPERPDRTFAVMTALGGVATLEQQDDDLYNARWSKAWTAVGRLLEKGLGEDYVAPCARLLAKKRPKDGLIQPHVQKVIRTLSGVVREAGLV